MKKTALQIFEELDDSEFFKDFERACLHFRSIKNFPTALEFDGISGGFLVLHRKHQDAGLEQELPVCQFLKSKVSGFACCRNRKKLAMPMF